MKDKKERVLVVVAHPDDETVACAGTIKQLIDNGDSVSLVCATLGEAGDVSDEAQSKLKQAGSVGKLRQQELDSAINHLGISKLKLLDYQDGQIIRVFFPR